MRPLGYQIADLVKLGEEELRTAILERRTVIRYHRDQIGDNRCWLDDYLVWTALDDTPPEPLALPEYAEMMSRCENFFCYRRSETADPIPADAMSDPVRWKDDIEKMNGGELARELLELQFGIRSHRDISNRIRTIDDDRALYLLLPEHLSADFRLPPQEAFLGTAIPCAGCPNFWKSHQNCSARIHNTHQWGPCK